MVMEPELRKHKSQMTEDEIERLRGEVDTIDISSVEITSYTYYRFEQRFTYITLLDVAEVFVSYDIIEFNTHSDDRRVLLRSTKDIDTIDGSFNVCIIYSLVNNRIITAWLNNARDHHDTLRIGEYTKDLDISW